jgi:hypothetical protein
MNADEALDRLAVLAARSGDPFDERAAGVLRTVVDAAKRSQAGRHGGPAHLVRLRDALAGLLWRAS